MKAVLIAAAIIAALVAIDRLALAAEERGWIYWRRRKASPGTRSAAMLEMQSLLEPGKRHVIEAKAETREEDASGAE
ncbi:MAG TPA: hypothetical protein VF698_16125 [Thermoanaerobaculia bacterium]|jgi:hypothetical protein